MSRVLNTMTHTRRPRRYVGRRKFLLLRPAFRYSSMRDAWVLHVVGERYGPVLRRREDRDLHT